jgi:sortase A
MQVSLKRSLGWVETGFYLAGIALLAVFFVLRFDADSQREAGIAAFHQAAGSGAAERQVRLAAAASAEGLTATIAAPSLELWADKRIREYAESLKVEAAPPLAVMTMDQLGIQVPVYDGADDFNLNRGVARIGGTAAVGAVGNLGIAGHRDGFFRGLKDVAIGDRIDLLTGQGNLAYTVSSIEIVDPSDVWVLAPTDQFTMTLVTCYPFYYVGHAPKRFIVKATAEHSLANKERGNI